jgi:signal transduction histidine kinase/response regulator of citrate/malate metabolism
MPAKILVVDDDLDLESLFRQKFRQQIQQQRLQFVFVHNGVEALEKLETETGIEVVLADINMPEMDGLSLLQEIKTAYPLVRVVIVSAYADLDHVRKAMNYGAFDFLPKPINFRDLEATTLKTLDYVQQLKLDLLQERERRQQQDKVLARLTQEIAMRQQTEKALRESEATTRALVTAIPDLLIWVTGEGTYKAIAGRDSFQIHDQDNFQEGTSIYDSLPEDLARQRMQHIQAALKTQEVQLYEQQLTIDGEQRYEEVRIVNLGENEALIIVRDITERRQAELERARFIQVLAEKNQDLQIARDQLQQANQTLEQRVQERTQALSDTLEKLQTTQEQIIAQEKLASLGALTAGIAHEIKNPLNFINNFADLNREIAAELQEELNDQRQQFNDDTWEYLSELMADLQQNSQKILDHGGRADGIVNSMLLHSRGGKGEVQKVNINALLTEATNLAYHGLRAQDKTFNITIDLDLAPQIAAISLVASDINRVFLNIINNACYATQQKAKQAQNGYSPTLQVSTQDLADAVEVRIRDNGPGIPVAIRERIFEPFFTTKPAGKGTGLGLSMCYDIVVQQHQGEIHIDSHPGEFTEFTIKLPRSTFASAHGRPE